MAVTVCDKEVHIGDIGTQFLVTLTSCEGGTTSVVPLDGATSLEVLFTKPNKTVVTKTAVLHTDGIDGILKYIGVDGDIDLKGTWKIQARAGFPDGSSYSSSIGKFKVYPNLD
jgi:hypothetical protein